MYCRPGSPGRAGRCWEGGQAIEHPPFSPAEPRLEICQTGWITIKCAMYSSVNWCLPVLPAYSSTGRGCEPHYGPQVKWSLASCIFDILLLPCMALTVLVRACEHAPKRLDSTALEASMDGRYIHTYLPRYLGTYRDGHQDASSSTKGVPTGSEVSFLSESCSAPTSMAEIESTRYIVDNGHTRTCDSPTAHWLSAYVGRTSQDVPVPVDLGRGEVLQIHAGPGARWKYLRAISHP